MDLLTEILSLITSYPLIAAVFVAVVIAFIISVIKKVLKAAVILFIILLIAGGAVFHTANDMLSRRSERILNELKQKIDP